MFKLSGLIFRKSCCELLGQPGALQGNARQVRKTQTVTSVREILAKSAKPEARSSNPNIKYALLVIPVASFGLGCWQIRRLMWKNELVKTLISRTSTAAVDLPIDLNDVEDMEYLPVKVRGHFVHEREIVIGPRSRIEHDPNAQQSGSFMSDRTNTNGYLVVTPFKLSDRDVTILVNRGWVPHAAKRPSARQQAQTDGEVELSGVVRLAEKRAPFVPANQPEKMQWFYRDLDAMASVCRASPVWIDARGLRNPPEGWPVPNQTRITLRNEHLSYLFTWFSLSALTAIMWYQKFARRAPKKFCV